MPLKHFTETFLVVALAAAMAVTGLLVATLPPLSEGALPWGVLFVISIIYPLSLYGLFQNRRADNFFRNLHWFPALMLLGWLSLQALLLTDASRAGTVALYTWGWTLGAVVLGFILIVVYCLKVIRRRIPRLVFLALILIPFTAVAVMSEWNGTHLEREVASVLWQGDFWSMKESGLFARLTDFKSQTGKNLDPSEDPAEEGWRERLRAQQRREERIAQRAEEGKSSKSVSSAASSGKSSKQAMIGSVSSRPTQLPSSGFAWSGIVLVLAACYCAALHRSTQKRMSN